MRINLIGLIVTALSISLLCSCVIVVGESNPGTDACYRLGKLQTTIETTFDKSFLASKQAVSNLKFERVTEKTDVVSAQLQVTSAQNKKITININKITENTTKISIKAGFWGDQALSCRILEEIKKCSEALDKNP